LSTSIIILIIVAAAVTAVALILYVQKERTRRLRGQFGPEYDRMVDHEGNPRKAEEELAQRQKRIEKLHIRELPGKDVDRFAEAWRKVQTRFVDAPASAVAEADRLVRDVMNARGYPMGSFEQRAADISVDHPRVVQSYRVAHDIAVRDAAGKATTEDLRQAMVHYRDLFDELLGVTHAHSAREVRR
jgi:hypothetical protein